MSLFASKATASIISSVISPFAEVDGPESAKQRGDEAIEHEGERFEVAYGLTRCLFGDMCNGPRELAAGSKQSWCLFKATPQAIPTDIAKIDENNVKLFNKG